MVNAVDDVFGVSRDVPLNYVDRTNVDGKFLDSLTRKHHIVIYGSSKQGKTCLRKHCLDESDFVVVACQNRWKLSDLHSAILKQCGYEVALSKTQTVSGHSKISATVTAKLKAYLLGEASTQVAGEVGRAVVDEIVTTGLELDPADANDIIRALEGVGFKKFIAIEDFHYLPDETQRDFSFALKTFHEQSKISFIVTGVWREQNRLIAFNGDLTERVFSVDVDNWEIEDLQRVIAAGGALMNVSFTDDFCNALLLGCNRSVHLVQEACRRLCREHKIFQTSAKHMTIGVKSDASRLLSNIVDEQSARYIAFLMGFSEGFQATELGMQRWLIYVILTSTADELSNGMRLGTVSKKLRTVHPRGDSLNAGNITQALGSATSLQAQKGTRPIVLDYDAANRNLHIVDKGFLLWLAHQDREALLEDLGF